MRLGEHWENNISYVFDVLDATESWDFSNFTVGCFSRSNIHDFYIPINCVFPLGLGRGLRCPATPILVHNRFHFSGLDVWETKYFWNDERQYPVVGLDPFKYRSRLATVLSL